MRKYISFEDNLRMAYVYCPNLRSVSVGVFVNVGSANETAKQNGLSHILEHMVFKGSKRSSAIELSQKGDLLGGRINAATSVYSTVFYGTVVDYMAEDCFALLSELTTEPAFPAEEWEKERNVILEELSMGEDDYEDLSYENLMKTAYPDMSIGRPVIGNKKNIKRFTCVDIKSYYNEHYRSGNVIIVVCGNIEFENATALCRKYFVGKFPYSEKQSALMEGFHASVASEIKEFKKSSQANLVIGFPTIDMYDDKVYDLTCLDGILGAGMSSRLFVNLREKKGLCYSVYSFKNCMRSNGIFCIYIGTNSAQIPEAIREIKRTISEVISEGISEKEFLCAQAMRNTSFTLSFESSLNIMRMIGRNALNNDELFDFDSELEKYNAVTPERALEMLKHIDQTAVQISYVGEKIDYSLLEVFRGNE